MAFRPCGVWQQTVPVRTCRAAVAPAASANTSTALCDLPASQPTSEHPPTHGKKQKNIASKNRSGTTRPPSRTEQSRAAFYALPRSTGGLGSIYSKGLRCAVQNDCALGQQRSFITTRTTATTPTHSCQGYLLVPYNDSQSTMSACPYAYFSVCQSACLSVFLSLFPSGHLLFCTHSLRWSAEAA